MGCCQQQQSGQNTSLSCSSKNGSSSCAGKASIDKKPVSCCGTSKKPTRCKCGSSCSCETCNSTKL
ncbi:LAMI_0E07536g1_1 [Lachancea mirantina]|uniref:LAMI_0E07536g1_1 n=1 Tax=Lachancea mirantina TaxID=1230905 RepID=A0A1G4JMN0_9SACH|nr:LAMI_0E07536g1_1 [Lachancea mirantina]